VPAPNQVVYALNKALTENNDTNMFVTVFVGVLHLDTGLLYYCNAGHDAPILINKDGQDFLPVDSNIPIGIQPDWEFSLQETTIGSGSTIFLYTDGLTEAEDKDHEQFGTQRMIETIQSSNNNQPKLIINNMKDAIHSFVGEAEQSDDLTMLAIWYEQTK
jgi:sigma-B regulation protein RsbU (phosphoserine phosphatase)